jgi:hypothetical protein
VYNMVNKKLTANNEWPSMARQNAVFPQPFAPITAHS